MNSEQTSDNVARLAESLAHTTRILKNHNEKINEQAHTIDVLKFRVKYLEYRLNTELTKTIDQPEISGIS